MSEVSERASERSGGREQSEQSGASERVSGASEPANGRVSGPVLMSLFLFVPDHSGLTNDNDDQAKQDFDYDPAETVLPPFHDHNTQK